MKATAPFTPSCCQRWVIEESFRIMKSEFRERPAHLHRDSRIRAHFLFGVMSLAVNGGNPELLRRIGGHLFLELLIIKSGHRDGSHTENRIETADTLLLFHLFNSAVCSGGNVRDIHQRVENIGLVAATGLLIEVFQDVPGHQFNPLRSHECLLTVNVPDILIIDIWVCVHGFDIVHAEGQHILVIDGIHDCVGVELISESLPGRKELRISDRAGIGGKDQRAGESEHVILLKALDDSRVHVTELTAVAFVKDDYYMLLIDPMSRILLDKGRELLYGRDDDMGVWIFQLTLQDHRTGIAVGRTFLKAVVFLHGLVVQILAVHHEENLVDIGKLRCLPGRLEGRQGLSGACSCQPCDTSFLKFFA